MSSSSGFEFIDYYGGPLDGEAGAMSDGVRMVQEGGFYQAEWLNGTRRLVWHEVPGMRLTDKPETD